MRILIIGICDDENFFCNQLKNEIYKYSNDNELETVVEIFHNGDDLLKCKEKFDIIFLDYKMSKTDGLTVAKELRKRNTLSSIIFVSAYPEIVYQTFMYETFRFLRKPLKTDELYEALNSYRKSVNQHHTICISISGEHICINTKDIIYIEATGKNSIIRLNDIIISYPHTLSEVSTLLPEKCFFRSHRSFLVNFEHIISYNKKQITFKNGEYAKISRDIYNLFNDKLITYFSDYHI